jgi:hypothetical protein
VIQGIIELAEVAAKEPWAVAEESEATKTLKARISALGRARMAEAYKIIPKLERQNAVGAGAVQQPGDACVGSSRVAFGCLGAVLLQGLAQGRGLSLGGGAGAGH